jgi:hypothetical protein
MVRLNKCYGTFNMETEAQNLQYNTIFDSVYILLAKWTHMGFMYVIIYIITEKF